MMIAKTAGNKADSHGAAVDAMQPFSLKRERVTTVAARGVINRLRVSGSQTY
jgi:hypothetical protein